jgi:hypothetical protein
MNTDSVDNDTLTTEVVEPVLPPNPLLSVRFKPIGHYRDWLERLSFLMLHGFHDEVMGMLHTGFKKKIDYRNPSFHSYRSRLITYIGLADGWADTGLMENPDERRPSGQEEQLFIGADDRSNDIMRSQAEIRKKIARKALEMVSPHLFKPGSEFTPHQMGEDQEGARWFRNVVMNEYLFPLLMAFFAPINPSKHGNVQIRNLPSTYGSDALEKNITGFVANLCADLWRRWFWGSWQSEERNQDEVYWTLEIMAHISRLDIAKPYIGSFDDVIVSKLTEIALRKNVDWQTHSALKKRRTVRDIDEALFAGSGAAELVIRHLHFAKAKNRLDELEKLERMQRETEEKMRKLS